MADNRKWLKLKKNCLVPETLHFIILSLKNVLTNLNLEKDIRLVIHSRDFPKL
jgi:hypothetical protein